MSSGRNIDMPSWSITSPGTQTAGTAITGGIPPFPGYTGPRLYNGNATGLFPWATTCPYLTTVTQLGILTGSTAHKIFCLRPLNWAVVSVAGAINTTSFTLKTDPGKYSVNYKYPLGGGLTAPASTADLTFTTTHYFAVQLADGTWFFDLCAGFNTSTLVVTTTTTIPNVTGGGIPVGAVMFLLGSGTTVDPATGSVPPSITPNISVYTNFQDDYALFTALHPGDPMFILDANGTAADTITNVSGVYRKVA